MNAMYSLFWKHLLNTTRIPLIWKLSIYTEVKLLSSIVTMKNYQVILLRIALIKRKEKASSFSLCHLSGIINPQTHTKV